MKKVKIIAFIILMTILISYWKWVITPHRLIYNHNSIDKVDYILLGSSNIFDNFNPLEIWNQTGYTGYNLTVGNQSVRVAYYQLKQAIKISKPEVVFYDCYAFAMGYGYDSFNHLALDRYPLTTDKIKFLKEAKLNQKELYFFPFLQWHNRWEELMPYDFKKDKFNNNLDFMGYLPAYHTYEYNFKLLGETETQFEIDKFNTTYFEQIIELCKDNNIELIAIKTPTVIWKKVMHDKTKELTDRYKIKFIDFNLEDNFNELGIDMNTDYRDQGVHFNNKGANKASTWIANYLSNHFELTDKRKETSYSNWDVKYSKFLRYEYINKVTNETNIDRYCQQINEEGLVKLITVNTVSGQNTDFAAINQLLTKLKVDIQLNNQQDNNLILIMDDDKIIYSALDSKEISKEISFRNHKIYLESTMDVNKISSKIQVDNINYSFGNAGVNIAVVDKLYDEVIDRVNINSSKGALLLTR